MKKIHYLSIFFVSIGLLAAYLFNKVDLNRSISKNSFTPQEIWEQEYLKKKEKRKIGYSKANKPDMFSQYFKDITTQIGEHTSGYQMDYTTIELNKARSRFENLKMQKSSLDWIQRGPGNVGGRTRALIVDPDDATHNTWYAGAVSGGVWKTTDGGQNWANLSDNFTNLAISAMEMAPSNHNVIYAGTGESFPGGTLIMGNGVWKSINRGITWTQLSNTAADLNFRYVNRIVIDPNNADIVLVATYSGIFKSTDGGTSWTKTYTSKYGVEDLVADPANFNIIFGGDNSIGVIRSTNYGDSWKVSSTGLTTGTRFEIAVSPVDHNNVYTSVNVSDSISNVYISKDNGINWTKFNDNQNFLGGQGDYNNSIEAHPYIADEVFVGGVDIWKLKFDGTKDTSAPLVRNVFTDKTDFLTFVNFGGDFLGGGMSTKDGKNIVVSDWVSVEIRFGPGLSQKAHRFTVPDRSTSGVPAASFAYVDYVDVPFQVWDVTNNKQLMVSFRDQEKDGKYNLYKRISDAYGELGREYIFVNSISYDPVTPNPDITVNGGHLNKSLYMFWPILADGSVWNPASLPESKIIVEYGTILLYNGVKTNIADAYGNSGGANKYNQSKGLGTAAIPGLHPDHHQIVIVPLGSGNFKVVDANDGGLAVSNDNGVNYTQLPNNYITTQFYGVAKNPVKNEYIGGMQDNGTWRSPSGVDASATSKYLFQVGGDGFECLWHSTKPALILASVYNNSIKRTANGGSDWTVSTGITADDGPFITRLSASKEKPDLVFAVGGTGVYRSGNFGTSFLKKTITENWSISGKVSGSHRVEVSQANGNIVWAGAGMSKKSGIQMQVSTDEGVNFSAVADFDKVEMNSYVSGLACHPTEDSTAYVLFSLSDRPKVLRTKNLGKSWEDISGFGTNKESSNGFPDVVVHSLVVMPHNPNIIWVGTEIGLFESIDNGKTWHYANNGMPPVSIFKMIISGDQVVLGTHGRGIWSVTIPEINKSPFITDFNLVEGKTLSLSANFKVVYDSVVVFLNNSRYSVLKTNTIGVNSIPVTTSSGGTYNSYLIGYLGGNPYESNTIDVNFEPTAVEKNMGYEMVNFYPNPASYHFNFNLDRKYEKYRIELFNITGQKVFSQHFNNALNNRIHVDYLKEGVYFVHLYYDDKKTVKALVVKR